MRPACQTLSKALDISGATAWVAPDLFYALVIISDTTVRRSAVDQEDLKPYQKSEKGHISLGDQESYYLQVFQRTNRTAVFNSWPFPNIHKHRDHQWDLPTIWKTRLLQTHIEEFS